MNLNEMKQVIRDNPQWDVLEAFEELSNTNPTAQQVTQATEFGGLYDSNTIRSLPLQFDWARKKLWELYPCFIFDEDNIWRTVMMTEFGRLSIAKKGTSWLSPVMTTSFRKGLDLHTASEPHCVTSLYREVFDRDPDPEGFEFWKDIYEYNDWSKSEIEEAFRNSPEGLAMKNGTSSD